MLYVSMKSKQHLQLDSDLLVQLGQPGWGEWHQRVAPDGRGRLRAAPLTKEGSNYPLGSVPQR